MVRNARVVARVAVVLLAVVAAVALNVMPQAFAVTSHRALNDTRPVGSAPVTVDFPIEYFGVVADLTTPGSRLDARGPAPYGQARFRVRGHWTPWQSLDQDGAQVPGHFTGALVSVDGADAYQVRGLTAGAHHWRAAAINTTDGPTLVVGHRRADAADASTSACMSRADWGADESISGWSKGDIQTYNPVQTLTVHHTAGSNDPTQDYAATVRAIYSYHVQSNGWSDIGYQYLIDGTGKVYEGRNSGHVSKSCLTGGGTGSDFAHQTTTDNVVTGAHVANYNSGNLGLALMGCYEPTSACSGATTPPAGAKDGLENLLAALSTRHGLDPGGRVHYVNPVSGAVKDIPTISGHRDWEATACPGGNLYADLPAIRTDVASRMTNTTTVPPAPGNLSAAVSGSVVSLTWTPPASDGGSPVTRYEVFRDTATPVSTANPPIYSGNATSASDPRTAGTYYYAVRACNTIGCGATATAGPVTVTGSATPAKITSGSCSGATCTFTGTGSGSLSWNFGNNTTRTGSPVTATYTSRGTYTVTLTDSLTPATRATRSVTCSLVKRALRCAT